MGNTEITTDKPEDLSVVEGAVTPRGPGEKSKPSARSAGRFAYNISPYMTTERLDNTCTNTITRLSPEVQIHDLQEDPERQSEPDIYCQATCKLNEDHKGYTFYGQYIQAGDKEDGYRGKGFASIMGAIQILYSTHALGTRQDITVEIHAVGGHMSHMAAGFQLKHDEDLDDSLKGFSYRETPGLKGLALAMTDCKNLNLKYMQDGKKERVDLKTFMAQQKEQGKAKIADPNVIECYMIMRDPAQFWTEQKGFSLQWTEEHTFELLRHGKSFDPPIHVTVDERLPGKSWEI